MPESFGEERADRAIDQATGQDLVLGRGSLALAVAARKPADRRETLAILDREREEIGSLALPLRRHNRDQDDGVPLSRDDRATRLMGDVPPLDRERPVQDPNVELLHVDPSGAEADGYPIRVSSRANAM